jgi:hypothetical protein
LRRSRSGFFRSPQLKRSHHWWVQQQSFLEEQRYTQRKNDLYELAARVLPSLDATLVDLQVLLFSRSECEYLLKYTLKPELVNRDFVSKEYERYIALIIEKNAKVNELTAEMQQIAFASRRFYSDGIEKYFIGLTSNLKIAKRQIFSLAEVNTYLNDLLEHGVSIDSARAQLGTLFDKRYEEIKLGNSIGGLLDLMFSENYPRLSSSSQFKRL